jgi:Pregnancy-associated plasma protein-A/Secretion system C-terminal sorting domain
MKKSYLFLLFAGVLFAGNASAQEVVIPCKTDAMTKIYQQQHPELAVYEKQLEEQTANYIKNTGIGKVAKKTTASTHNDTDYYDIPLVVHVIHNYGSEFLPDNKIYRLVDEMNRFYDLRYNYSAVIAPFQKYIGKAKIRFHLATIDPNGNPTNGITRHLSYLTYGYDDNAKLDQWSPTSYVNIWFENVIGATTTGGIIVAYATPPSSAASYPPSDGIICNYSFINDTNGGHAGGSIDHEMGHVFNLKHTFGSTNNPHTNKTGDCGDDDGVDDTPPTEGNLGGCSLYDSVCATNYFKVYTDIHGNDSLVNYPDTSNEQNIMNYADCKVMFTKGQVQRMRAALNSDIGGRNNLWDSLNLVKTGALAPRVDLKPIPEFNATPISGTLSSTTYMDRNFYFTFPGTDVMFVNHSWNDTVTAVNWTFSNTAAVPTSTAMGSVTNHFTDPGWVTLTMTVSGNNSGDATKTWNRAVFVADNEGTNGHGYVQEFNGADTAKWPMFNYYNNNLKWQYSDAGFYDNSGVMYNGYDDRINPLMGIYPATGNPRGDYDDFFTIPFDLSAFPDGCSLNFFYSGASRSSNSLNINDELDIDYSTGKNNVWTNLKVMKKTELCNKGSMATPYKPLNMGDWNWMSINIPGGAKTNYTVFRFRYKPGIAVGYDGTVATGSFSSGNNFYMDRISISPWAAGTAPVKMGNNDMVVSPNPTKGNAYVLINDAINTTAKIIVTDITGKVVYTTTQDLNGSTTRVEIPQNSISVSGMYIVQVVTGSQVHTQKLVVE